MKITKALFLVLFVIMLVTLLASCASIKCMDPFNDHTIVIDEAVEPTCSSTGLTQGEHCKDCGKIFVFDDETDPADEEERSLWDC